MNKPRIALLIDWYLPGTKAGGPVRSVYSLITLLRNDFDLYLITTNKDLGTSTPYHDVKADTLFEKDKVHYYYFSHEKLTTEGLLTLLKELNPDLVYLNSFWSYYFSIAVVKFKRQGHLKAPILLAPRGMLGKGALQVKPLKKKVYLFIAKVLGWYKQITFHATQEQEKSDTLAKFSSAKVLISPNINASPIHENKSLKKAGHLKLFFLSRILPIKNLHFALEMLTSVPAEYTVEYDIFGNIEDDAYWADCQKIIASLPKNISVTYKGELKFHEVQDHICHYHFLFLPTLNENFGHSIVESLLCGCPAIISDQTPWNDLEKNNAGYAFDLKQPQRFVDALCEAARLDSETFAQKSRDTISYIQKKTDQESMRNYYKNMFGAAIGSRQA